MNVNRVRQQASQYLEYDIIRQYTELPSLPDYQIQLMLSFLHTADGNDKRSELYSLVTSLVQVGLDAHDQVVTKDGGGDLRQIRAKQLKVLAGDYLSGRYYELLSFAEDIEAVRALSEAISEVNLTKMNMYMRKQQRDLSGQQYLELLLSIRTRLFLAFEKDVAPGRRSLWRQLLERGTMCEIMQREHGKLSEIDADYDGWAVWELLHALEPQERASCIASLDRPEELRGWVEKLRLKQKLETMLEQQAEELARLAEGVRSEPLYAGVIAPMLERTRQLTARQYTYD